MIVKNLWRRNTRTFLTVLGIAIGVAAVVALSAFSEGMASGMGGAMTSADADIMVAQKDAVMVMMSVVDDEVEPDLRHVDGVAEVAGTIMAVIQMPETPYFVIKGEDPRGFAMKHYRIIEGETLSGRRQILLGSIAAKNYRKRVGETFRLNDRSFTVVGIYETGVSFEDNGAVVGLDDAQGALDKRDQVSYYGLKVKDPRQIDAVKAEIEARFDDLAATRSGEQTTQSEMLDLTRSFGWFLGIFAALVGGLGMMNATLMSVFERTREIGVLRALGWRRRRVIALIFGETLLMAFVGGIVGIILGIALTEAARLSPSVASMVGGAFTPEILVEGMVIALLLGSVGAVYPAWRASRLEPVEAMRYEGGAGGQLGPRTQRLVRLLSGTAFRNLLRRPTRTLVTVAGVGLGVGFVFSLMAVMDGFTVMYTNLLNAGKMDLMAQQANASEITVSSIPERTADIIARRPEVKAVAKQVFGMSAAPGLSYFMMFGLDPREAYAQNYEVREGRMIEREREIVLGRFAANGLEKGVGDTMRLAGTSFRVVGIYENGSVYEDAGGTVTLEDAQRLFGKAGQISFMSIALHDPGRATEVSLQLESEFPELKVVRMDSLGERLQEFQIMDASVNALIFITTLVGGIVMMNAMLMSVFERTQEIGVLRALGWRRRRVITWVMVESLGLSVFSAIAGIAMGMGLNYLFALEPTFGYFLAPVFTPPLFIKVLLLAVVLGTLGGIYPAWRASGLRPIEALRYE